MFLTADEVLMG